RTGRPRAASSEGVWLRGLAPGDVVLQRLVGGRVYGGCLVLGQHALGPHMGELHAVAPALVGPGLERLVIEYAGSPEGALEVGLGVGATKIMPAGANLA